MLSLPNLVKWSFSYLMFYLICFRNPLSSTAISSQSLAPCVRQLMWINDLLPLWKRSATTFIHTIYQQPVECCFQIKYIRQHVEKGCFWTLSRASPLNLTTVFWGLFRPRRVFIVPYFVIGWILLLLILVFLCITEGIQTDIWFSCRMFRYCGRAWLVSGVWSDPKAKNGCSPKYL